MNLLPIVILLTIIIGSHLNTSGQVSPDTYEGCYDLALKYDNLSLYAESIEEINKAIRIAEKNGWEEKRIAANIFLAETKRKTKDYKEGIEILRKLKKSSRYPELHVKKMGRMAALYHECDLPNEQKYDSVERYLYKAIDLAKKHNLRTEKAYLYNELGYRIGHRQLDKCLYLLGEAARIFIDIGDTQNHVVARTNLLRTYVTINDHEKTMSTFNELRSLIQGKNWHSTERELYSTINSYYKGIGDTTNANYWMVKCRESELLNVQSISSTRLNSYRAIYETNKYRGQVAQKESQLRQEEKQRNELFLFLIILAILSAGITIFFLRERRLKKSLSKANSKYHMLMVESNHRIKNNLQMIISMLNYSSRNSSKDDAKAYELMSSKIQTISALHKHLYADVHNESVDLGFYFNEIIKLQKDISSYDFLIDSDIDEIAVKSERIVYFGLIFNEMLTNTLEHNTQHNRRVSIKIKKNKSRIRFCYQDNSKFEQASSDGKGLMLIRELVRRVQGFNYQLDKNVGKYEFEFDSQL